MYSHHLPDCRSQVIWKPVNGMQWSNWSVKCQNIQLQDLQNPGNAGFPLSYHIDMIRTWPHKIEQSVAEREVDLPLSVLPFWLVLISFFFFFFVRRNMRKKCSIFLLWTFNASCSAELEVWIRDFCPWEGWNCLYRDWFFCFGI